MTLDSLLQDMNETVEKGKSLIIAQDKVKEIYDNLLKQTQDLANTIGEKSDMLDKYIRASTLIGNLADENTNAILRKITGVINKALAVLFIDDIRIISIKQIMYRKVYPHFVVELETSSGSKRSFKQSGSGLAQIISFLCVICLIDARGGRKIMVMDELLNGLHPDAKAIVRDLMLSLSKRFQFICVEYGLDVGKQYEVVKNGEIAKVVEYTDGTYYADLARKHKIEAEMSNKKLVSMGIK